MPIKTLTVPVAQLAATVNDPDRGVISLVGSSGGLALIVGDIEPSGLVIGTLAVETEHGTIYLDPEGEVEISEATPYGDEHEWLVEWSIDANGSTAEAAAAAVWRDTFGRSTAGADDACVFTVTDPATGAAVEIDLSEHDFDSLG